MPDKPRETPAVGARGPRDPLLHVRSKSWPDVTQTVDVVIVPIDNYLRVRVGLRTTKRSTSAVLTALDARQLALTILMHVGPASAEAELIGLKLSEKGSKPPRRSRKLTP